MEPIIFKIKKHQTALTQYLDKLAIQRNESLGSPKGYQAVIDLQRNQFQLAQIGWYKDEFIFQVLMHFSIHPETGNIWVQLNNTEIQIDRELAHWKIPKSCLVLGFRPTALRQLSEFAVM